MARFPAFSSAGAATPASIFARLREHLARFQASGGGDVIPLQIGDTYLPPAARLDEVTWTEMPPSELYAYGSPNGWAPLVDAIAAKAQRRNGIDAGAGGVQVTCGATHALSCAVAALLDPGDELILMTPYWPLIRGIALGRNVVPVEVPYGDAAALARAITPRTAGIYYATPNNPDGAMLDAGALAAVVDLAVQRDLWIFADEVYEDYVYDGAHLSAAALPGGAARTVTVFSFAKSFAQAGLRVGYALGPEPVIATIKKLVNHSVYNVPVAMQRAAHAALLADRSAFLDGALARYRAARDRARTRLAAPTTLPPGGAYLWLDLRPWSPDGDCMSLLERFAARGVLIAPGNAFGSTHGAFARLCFTGVPPDRLDEGIDRINAVLAG
ncbi:MAG: pyridoxal phosphate-dependent aminotransferase [Deltaproteobacteria bacterium]|nr:pyridoxal phosphate-dependent aminotransferase [Deltaproteobacteria bacterium]